MNNLVNNLNEKIADYFNFSIPTVGAIDIVEILIIAFFIYKILVWLKNTKAWMLMRGVVAIAIFFIIAGMFQMHTILWIGEKLLSAAILAIVVVFQPELRDALERLGRTSFWNIISSLGSSRRKVGRFSDKTLTHMVSASYEMGAVKTGALIVVEGDEELGSFIRTGIELDAVLTRQLLINIFEKNTPLHDGAIIVRGDRVVAATCYLPLSENTNLSKDLGTRHRAGIGMSEDSDALVIIVSEETGKVSVAQYGKLYRDIDPGQLEAMLKDLQKPLEDESKEGEADE